MVRVIGIQSTSNAWVGFSILVVVRDLKGHWKSYVVLDMKRIHTDGT